MMRRILLIFALFFSGFHPACAAESDDEFAASIQRLRFEAFVADESFSCEKTYRDLGLSGATAVVEDLRFYLHDIEVLDEAGHAVSVTLVDDGRWQNEAVALLDFTDGTGHCHNTSMESNTDVELLVPEGPWRGLRFRIGVPFEANHVDLTHAPAPLNVASMFWSWNAGFKFLRLDMPTTVNPGFRLHLGSTHCDPAPGGGVTGCEFANRPQVVVEDFDIETQLLRFDLAALLRTTRLDHQSENTPSGCMSTVDDPDCGPLFEALGLRDGSTAKPGIFTAREAR